MRIFLLDILTLDGFFWREVRYSHAKMAPDTGEYWLETETSILGSSSRRMRMASGSQSISCPVRKPRAKVRLAG